MPFGNKGNAYNNRLGRKEDAEHRRCPECGRGGALGRQYRHSDAMLTISQRECRYCGVTVATIYNHATATSRQQIIRPER